LESLVFSDVVSGDGSDVRIWLRLAGIEESATFNDLAEGERQLLTILGLLRFTEDDEALFILDEPDTHLNPAWCLDYLENLRKYGADLSTSQIIMTTHSPMTFAGLNRNEVVVLRRNDEVTPVAVTAENGSMGEIKEAPKRTPVIIAEHPTSSPKGMGFGAILTSDIFGLRSTLDADTLRDVERLRFLAAQPQRTIAEETELAKLNAELTPLGFSRELRDPLFKEFVHEMALGRHDAPDLWGAVLTADQRARRSKLVADVVQRLKARQEE
jgi:ABC-type multidrug transport system ATPase subunit